MDETIASIESGPLPVAGTKCYICGDALPNAPEAVGKLSGDYVVRIATGRRIARQWKDQVRMRETKEVERAFRVCGGCYPAFLRPLVFRAKQDGPKAVPELAERLGRFAESLAEGSAGRKAVEEAEELLASFESLRAERAALLRLLAVADPRGGIWCEREVPEDESDFREALLVRDEAEAVAAMMTAVAERDGPPVGS